MTVEPHIAITSIRHKVLTDNVYIKGLDHSREAKKYQSYLFLCSCNMLHKVTLRLIKLQPLDKAFHRQISALAAPFLNHSISTVTK